MTDQQPQRFRFSGTGDEYFRIWIVNVCLSIVTLGIYSAWAKVRRNQYFYRHTSLAGASFDYHGEPKAILKGRIAAVLMLLIYSLTSQFNPRAGLMVMAALMLIMPWLLVRSLRFRLHNTSYRGLRFAFHGSNWKAYLIFLLWPMFAALSGGILWPYAQQRIARYVRNNSTYGNSFFKFSASPEEYYDITVGAGFTGALVFGVLISIVTALRTMGLLQLEGEQLVLAKTIFSAVGTYLWIVVAYFYIVASQQNLVWNSTQLDEHGFRSFVKVKGMLMITISNLLLIILTLGLYKPYADIRMARYRLEHLELLPQGSIDDFVAGQQTQATAVGDEMADMFDLDIAL